MSQARLIIGEIESFQPVDGNWLRLDDLLGQLWETGESHEHIRDLFALLERFPEEDGAGVLWSVVHGLESLQGYESELVQSLRRKPSELTIALATRLINGGVQRVGDVSLFQLLLEVSELATVPAALRDQAERFLRKHAGA